MLQRVEELGGEGADSSAGVVDPIDTALGELQSARLVVMLQREKHEPIIGESFLMSYFSFGNDAIIKLGSRPCS